MPVVVKTDAIMAEIALYEPHERTDNKQTSRMSFTVHVEDVKLIPRFFFHLLAKNEFLTEYDFLLECFLCLIERRIGNSGSQSLFQEQIYGFH